MQNSLFRKQAIEYQKNRLHGDVIVMPSRSYLLISIFLIVWLICLTVWLVASTYTRQETVQGWLEPSAGVVKLFADSSNGKIRQILVGEGEYVEQGQALIIINGDRILSNGDSLENTLVAQYQHQATIIQQQLLRSGTIHQAQLQDIQQQINSSEQDLVQLNAQIETLRQRSSILAKRLNNVQEMTESGHVSSTDFEKLIDQQLALQSDSQALLREKVKLVDRSQHLNMQLTLLPQEHQNLLAKYHAQLTDIERDLVQLEGRRAYTLRASRTGTVTNLQAQLGQQTSLSLPLLSIVPRHSNIEAKLLVPVSAAGFIQTGQSLDIRYHAFPFQKFGLYQGHITSISDSVIMPNEVHGSPIKINQPAYLVKAKLSQPYISAYGNNVLLKPGMTLSADVKLSERSLLEWLFEPLYSLQGRI